MMKRIFNSASRRLRTTTMRSQLRNSCLMKKQGFSFSEEVKNEGSEKRKLLLDQDTLMGIYKIEKKMEENELTPDEINALKNDRIIRREFFNDAICISLKYVSVLYGGAQSQALRAELVRSCIDFVNHFVLYSINKLDLKDDQQMQRRVKNAIVLVPGVLFLGSGLETLHEVFNYFTDSNASLDSGHGIPQSLIPIYCLTASIAVESVIIFKNIKDATTQGISSDKSLREQIREMKNIFTVKKDPVLSAILHENLITMTSTVVPLVGQLLMTCSSFSLIDPIGCSLIGVIQIYCGISLVTENFKRLIGTRIDKKQMEEIHEVLQRNQYVGNLMKSKGTEIGDEEIKYTADISYDMDKLSKDVMASTKEAIEGLAFSQNKDQKYYYIKEILEATPRIIFKKLQEHQADIEDLIKTTNPHVVEFDIDSSHPDLLNWDELDKVKMIENAEFGTLEPPAGKAVTDMTNRILGTGYALKVKTKGIQKVFEETVKHKIYSNPSQNVQDYIDTLEDFEMYDDFRYEIVNNTVERRKSNNVEFYHSDEFNSDNFFGEGESKNDVEGFVYVKVG